jgi:hypothetical protein
MVINGSSGARIGWHWKAGWFVFWWATTTSPGALNAQVTTEAVQEPAPAAVARATTQPALDAVAAESFRPVSQHQIERGRHSLRSAAQQLERFLARGAADNARAWKRYLKWEALQQQLAASGSPDAQVLSEVLAQYYTGEPGLELWPFVNVREALLAWRRQVLAAADDNTARLYQEQLEAIQRDLDAGATASGGPLASLAARLEWLEQLGQAPRRVAEIRRQFGHPNLLVSASADVVSRGFAESVSELSPVNEMILRTHVRGTAHLQGDLSANLIPNRDMAIVELQLTGVAYSQTIGRQSPVRLYSRGVTEVLGRKRLLIDRFGVREEPATACCVTDNHIQCIQSESRFASRLITNVAWKRARQQEPLAERISAGRAAGRVAHRMDQQATARVASGNTRLRDKIQQPLKARDVYPRWLHLWTTSDRLRMAAVQGRATQLAAPAVPPQVAAHRVVAQVHESMLLNTAANAIGGLTVTDERAQDLVKEATGEVPEELQIKEDEDPWAITFDVQSPVQIELDNDQAMIAIRGRRFLRGEQELRQTIQIAARYQLAIDNGRASLKRIGDVEVTYPDKEGDRLSLAELRNKTFMTNKFEGLFKPEIGGEGIELPDRWAKLRELKLAHISSDNGWLTLGWN